MKKVIAIVGPTASGKSKLAIELADRLAGQVVSCDSVQVYKGLDIGSGKVREDERYAQSGRYVAHHLLDLYEPTSRHTVYDFQQKARQTIDRLSDEKIPPVLCGGTGLYFQAVVDDYHFEKRDPQKEERRRNFYQAYYEDKGGQALYDLLSKKDPQAAEKIHPHNIQRLLSALVRSESLSGQGPNMEGQKQATRPVGAQAPYYQTLIYAISMDREVLYDRINRRVDAMIEEGLIEETRKLLEGGASLQDKAMQALGYRHMCQLLKGEKSLEEAVYEMKRDTRHFAKRQLTWFRRDDRIRWISYEKEGGFWPALEGINRQASKFF